MLWCGSSRGPCVFGVVPKWGGSVEKSLLGVVGMDRLMSWGRFALVALVVVYVYDKVIKPRFLS